MNCAECRDNLVACAEGLLDREECSNARPIWKPVPLAGLNTRLSPACNSGWSPWPRGCRGVPGRTGHARVHQKQIEPERETLMSILFKHRWGFGLGAAASAAAVILISRAGDAQCAGQGRRRHGQGRSGRGQTHQHPPARPTAHLPAGQFQLHQCRQRHSTPLNSGNNSSRNPNGGSRSPSASRSWTANQP